ncbi:MAG TPA: response regulator transcription factor [Marmoricola sp.]|nr:response regulator transcription factor [Marmoricola sp.]
MIRVLLADDQPLLRMGFRMVLEAHDGLEVVGEAADGREAVVAVGDLDPDVVIMDVRMPGLDGIEATRQIVTARPDTRILILTTFDIDEYAVEGLKAGASGFLLKDVPPAELVSAIHTVAAGDSVVAPAMTRRLLDRFVRGGGEIDQARLEILTSREQEVLELIGLGHTNQEIAEQLFLSEATVKTHVSRILGKLQLRDRVQAVIFAYQTRLVRPQ